MIPSAALVFWSAAVSGAPASIPPVEERVVVTAERAPRALAEVPAAVSVLTREQIAALPARTLAELIPYLPGLFLWSSAPSGSPPMTSARGFFGGGEAEYLQLRVDGVPVGDAESGIAGWRTVSATEIERVEALRGPAAPLYGDTAFAGVVEVSTRQASEPGGRAAVEAGNGGLLAGRVVLAERAGSWGLEGVLAAEQAEGWRDHAASNMEGLDLRARRGDASKPGGSWALRVNAGADEGESPGLLPLSEAREDPDASDPLFRFDEDRTRRLALSASHRRSRDGSFLHATLYSGLRDNERVRTLLLAPGFGLPTRKDLASNAFGAILETGIDHRVAGRNAQTSAGLEASIEEIDVAYHAVDEEGAAADPMGRQEGGRRKLGAYAATGWEATSWLRVLGSLRFDVVDDDFEGSDGATSQWSPAIGVTWSLPAANGSAASVYAKFSRAFKAPTLEQLFDPLILPDGSGGGFTISNPTLVPQTAGTLEAGATFASASVQAQLVLYQIDVENEIDFDPATFRYGNIGSTRHRGLEASGTVAISRAVSAIWSWDWSRVWSRADPEGRQLKNVPEHVVRAGVAVALPRRWDVQLVAVGTEGRYLDDSHTIPLSEVRSLDLRVRKGWGVWAAEADLRNLTGERWDEAGLRVGEGPEGAYVLPSAGARLAGRLVWSF